MDKRIFFMLAILLFLLWIVIPITAYAFKSLDLLWAWLFPFILSIIFTAGIDGSNNELN